MIPTPEDVCPGLFPTKVMPWAAQEKSTAVASSYRSEFVALAQQVCREYQHQLWSVDVHSLVTKDLNESAEVHQNHSWSAVAMACVDAHGNLLSPNGDMLQHNHCVSMSQVHAFLKLLRQPQLQTVVVACPVNIEALSRCSSGLRQVLRAAFDWQSEVRFTLDKTS